MSMNRRHFLTGTGAMGLGLSFRPLAVTVADTLAWSC